VHLAVQQHPAGAGHDHVGLLLLAVAVGHRAAHVAAVAEQADPQVSRVEVLAREAPLDPGSPVTDGVLDLQQVYGGELRHVLSLVREACVRLELQP